MSSNSKGAYRTADSMSPYWDADAVTPSDDTVIPCTRAIYVGGAGNIVVRMHATQNNITFTAVPVGTILRIQVDQILATDTTATNLVALR